MTVVPARCARPSPIPLPATTIQFATNLSGTTILLTTGQLAVSNSLTIDASALPGGIQINGHRERRGYSIVIMGRAPLLPWC